MHPDRRWSELKKSPTGIEGFDEISAGGLPLNRTTLVMGGPGSGKTVFALQTLVNGVKTSGERGIFVAFEENSRQIISNTASFGWGLDKVLEDGDFYLLDARLSPDLIHTGGFDLIGLLATIEAKAAEMGARRIIFDSIDVLLVLLNDPATERREMYRIHDWLSTSGLTGIITIRLEGIDSVSSERYGFLQFMADCVIELRHRVEDQISSREIRILKYRGSKFSENVFPFSITQTGIEIAGFGPSEMEFPVSEERVSSGVERLDTMLRGGYLRGSSILVTGAPGTAKSTLSAAFIEAACKRKEKCLYISFDEGANEIIRNMESINIRLETCRKAGLLQMYSARSGARNAEEHLIVLRGLMERHRPACVVIDPLSAIGTSQGVISVRVAQRLISYAKKQMITMLFTSLIDETGPDEERTPMQVSTIADTWIHLSYLVNAGERNRALTIVKSRGTGHSNQVRELVLSDSGITLSDVFSAAGEVLMGTMRAEKEREEQLEKERKQAEYERRKRQYETAQLEAQARLEALRIEIEARRADMDLLSAEHKLMQQQWHDKERLTKKLRRGD